MHNIITLDEVTIDSYDGGDSGGGGTRIYTAGVDDISVCEGILNVLENGGTIYYSSAGGVTVDPGFASSRRQQAKAYVNC